MDIRLKIDKAQNVRIHTVRGAVTRESLFEYLGGLYSAPDFDRRMNILWDLTEADLNSFSLSGVVEVRDYVEKSFRKPLEVKAALVVGSEMDFTLATMYETLLKESAVYTKVFLDMDEAWGWIVA